MGGCELSSTQDKLIGAQFDALDKGVARRAADLLPRTTIAHQVYDEWITDLTQLSDFANANAGVSYVNRQWTSEIPKYQQIDDVLAARVVVANPANYDNRLPITGGRVSGCGCSDKGLTPYVPGNYGSGGGLGTSFFSGDTVLQQSIGDKLRGNPLPYVPVPSASQSVGTSVFTQLLVAAIVGLVLWGFHYLTKKKII